MNKKIELIIIDENLIDGFASAGTRDILVIAKKVNEIIEFLNKREQVRK